MARRLMYLLDTNVWLELLLDQEKGDVVRRFLATTERHLIGITDFSLHSVGVILARLRKEDVFLRFLSDTVEDSGVVVLPLNATDLRHVIDAHRDFRLDFDDAYQYVAAEKHDLTLVSFDGDFDRTERGRKTPAQLLAS